MDLLNEEKLQAAGTVLLDRAMTDAQLLIEKTVRPELDAVVEQVSNVMRAVLLGVQATADKATADVAGIIAGLDGWTVEIGPIQIPTITIRLSKPKE